MFWSSGLQAASKFSIQGWFQEEPYIFHSNTAWELRIHAYHRLLLNNKFWNPKFHIQAKNGDGNAKKVTAVKNDEGTV